MTHPDLETIKKLDLKAPYVWVATWLGFGFLRPAPGTWGSLGALPFGLLIYAAAGLPALFVAIIAATLAGYWAAVRFEQATDVHDSKMVVIDEVAGQWLALLPGLYFTGMNPVFVFLSFLLFRFFDITKPWPASYFDKKVKGAIGVMGDDIVAGIYAALVILGIIYAGFG